MHGVFFPGFLLSRNHKIQIVARVGRKSAVVLSGIMEASYSLFFIGRGFNCSRQSSRIHFPPLRSKGGKSILEKWSRESGKEKGPVNRNVCYESTYLLQDHLYKTLGVIPRKSEKSAKVVKG